MSYLSYGLNCLIVQWESKFLVSHVFMTTPDMGHCRLVISNNVINKDAVGWIQTTDLWRLRLSTVAQPLPFNYPVWPVNNNLKKSTTAVWSCPV